LGQLIIVQIQRSTTNANKASIFNANIHYQHDNWAIAIWGKNLFGTQYSHLKFDLSSFLGMLEDFKGEGRRFGLDVSYQF